MRERPSSSELVAWSLVGLCVGVVAGFALGGWLGPVERRRGGPDATEEAEDVVPLKAAAAERAVTVVLGQDPDLKRLALTVRAVSPGVVELHGWVPDRRLRAHATRVAARVAGIESLVNCLLVHGEDDAASPALDATDQPA